MERARSPSIQFAKRRPPPVAKAWEKDPILQCLGLVLDHLR
jgi:hypothetical protein